MPKNDQPDPDDMERRMREVMRREQMRQEAERRRKEQEASKRARDYAKDHRDGGRRRR